MSNTDSSRSSEERGSGAQRALIGAGLALGVGAGLLFGSKLLRGSGEEGGGDGGGTISDAPPSTFRGKAGKGAPISRTVTVNRPARELYAFWRDFTNLPQVMDNVVAVEKLDETRSRWTIAAPAGTEIEFVSRITEDQPGRVIAWESEEGAPVRNAGRIEFLDAAPGRGTMVRATIDYDPPLGVVGKVAAKVLQREPNVQARRDLRRFKQLMETGEITSSAGPSGRKAEEPSKQYL